MDTPTPIENGAPTPEQQAAQRQQIANTLLQRMAQQQATRPMQGQTVNGFYVPPSPMQGLSNLGWGAMGAYAKGRQGNQNAGLFGMAPQQQPTRRSDDRLWNDLQPVA